MTIEEKLEKYRDEFLECKTPEAFWHGEENGEN